MRVHSNFSHLEFSRHPLFYLFLHELLLILLMIFYPIQYLLLHEILPHPIFITSWGFTPSNIYFFMRFYLIPYLLLHEILPHPIFIPSWDFTPSHIYSFISFNPIPYLFLHEFLAHPIFNPSWIFNPIPYLFLHKCSLFTSYLFYLYMNFCPSLFPPNYYSLLPELSPESSLVSELWVSWLQWKRHSVPPS